MTKTRCKFVLTKKDDNNNFTFTTQYDSSIPEDQRYCDATPWGEMKVLINNPAVVPMFEVGKAYYIDITPCEGN